MRDSHEIIVDQLSLRSQICRTLQRKRLKYPTVPQPLLCTKSYVLFPNMLLPQDFDIHISITGSKLFVLCLYNADEDK